MARRVACPQPPHPAPIRPKTLGRPGTRVFFLLSLTLPGPRNGSLPAHRKMVPMHHLGAALEAENQKNVGR
jgi:hypothetical protein